MMQRIHPVDAHEGEFFFTLNERGMPVVCAIFQWESDAENASPLSMIRYDVSGAMKEDGSAVRFPVFTARIPALNFEVHFEQVMN